ncbi:MAG: helix-turn-helix transcriptional regulator [Cyanobacteriota bacterium]|nr:helix-turn-helix transcriptional regulator [Cyanobacteriota bacterium]
MVGLLKHPWLDRLRRRKHDAAASEAVPTVGSADPLLEAGARIKQAREARGLGLRQLTAETLISVPVLEALERGWRDRLPETAYLRTMLPLLERYLELEPGSLRSVVSAPVSPSAQRNTASTRLPLLSVQLFTTWQGTAAYGVLLLALLYGLNLEQRRLAAQGLHALNPVPPLSEAAVRRLPPVGSDLLLQVYPEVRPLALARGGRGLQLVRQQGDAADLGAAPGVLELSLRQSVRLSLEAANGLSTNLQADSGELVLPLTPPLTLNVEPAAAPAVVRWNGEPLKPETPGRYRWPPRPVAAASSP